MLLERRKEQGLSAQKLGDIVGVDKTTIYRYEKGQIDKMPLTVANKLARTLNINPAFIFGFSSDPYAENTTILDSITKTSSMLSPSRQTKVYDFATHQLNEQTKYKNNDKIVSIEEFKIHEVELAGKVSAGGGAYNDKNYIETVEVESMPSHYDLAFQVSGDSMYPTFEDGEIIFVKETCDVYNGQIGVVEINKEAYVKKMYLEGKRLRLVSLNCDNKEDGSRLYPDFYADDHDELFIIGRVIL